MKILNLKYPHPSEENIRSMVKGMEEIADDDEFVQAMRQYANPEFLGFDSKKRFLPLTPCKLEVIGEGRNGTLASVYVVEIRNDWRINDIVRNIEWAYHDLKESISSQRRPQPFDKLTHLDELSYEISQLDGRGIEKVATMGFEFRTGDGFLESVAEYDGNFTSQGFNWPDNRNFDVQGKKLGFRHTLVRKAYEAARGVQSEIERMRSHYTTKIAEKELYGNLLTSIGKITDPKTEQKFMESLRA